jgi:large subunit ribosomal protein L9
MNVILLERVEHLGQMGDTVRVKPGYARNFLLPQKKAIRDTETNRKRFDAERSQLEARNLERRQEAEGVAQRAKDMSVVLVRQAGESGQLYGSVAARDIADAVCAGGLTIGRRNVRLDRPIKELGIYQVRIDLHPEVFITATVNVARSAEEAEEQARTGKAFLHTDEEPEAEAPEGEADEVAAEGPDQAEAAEGPTAA